MKKVERRCGYYWVCQPNTTPEIAYYWGKYWTMTGQDRVYREAEFSYIMPERFEPPTFEALKQFPTPIQPPND